MSFKEVFVFFRTKWQNILNVHLVIDIALRCSLILIPDYISLEVFGQCMIIRIRTAEDIGPYIIPVYVIPGCWSPVIYCSGIECIPDSFLQGTHTSFHLRMKFHAACINIIVPYDNHFQMQRITSGAGIRHLDRIFRHGIIMYVGSIVLLRMGQSCHLTYNNCDYV